MVLNVTKLNVKSFTINAQLLLVQLMHWLQLYKHILTYEIVFKILELIQGREIRDFPVQVFLLYIGWNKTGKKAANI